jgi:hypothetical protein
VRNCTCDETIATSISAVADRLQAILDELTSEKGIPTDFIDIGGAAAVAVPQYARYVISASWTRTSQDDRSPSTTHLPSNSCS